MEQSIIANVKVYGFYSEQKLSYLTALDSLTIDNALYSTLTKYPEVIQNDGSYDNQKVKFYIAGKPENMSVNIDFAPNSKEEGKKTFIFMLLYED